jgi:CRISPR system Cascade subunit CasE
MYLSQCVLNTIRPINPYQLHKKIWRLFPEQDGEQRSFLFRVENLGQTGVQKILLQSKLEPQSVSGDFLLLQSKEINLDGLYKQSKLRFMLRANPTKRIKDKNEKPTNQGKVRVAIINELEIVAWLRRQLQDCAEIKDNELSILRQDLLSFSKNKDKQQHFGKIQTVTYTGLMSITDNEALMNKMLSGIGPAKVFGCGLLSIARA